MTSAPPIRRRALLAGAAGASGLLAAPGLLRAQERFPSRPIEVVTHAGVGGGTDITARMMMVQAPGEFGVEFTVVNRTGGSGATALAYAASRPKDGHTVLLMTQTHLLTMLRSRTPTQFEDIVGIARATEDPQVLMVGRGSPYRTAAEFIAAAKARALKFGGTQVGGVDHVAVVSVARAGGFQAPTFVPFRGGGDIVINLVGGNIDAALVNPAEAEAQLRAGEVRALMAMSRERISSLPDVPTGKEAGIDAVASTTRGFAVLKGTPEDRIARLEEGLIKAMSGPIFQGYLTSTGQARDSVVGREAWQAQLAQFQAESRDALQLLGLLR